LSNSRHSGIAKVSRSPSARSLETLGF